MVAIGRCRRCLGVIRTVDNTSESTTCLVHRALSIAIDSMMPTNASSSASASATSIPSTTRSRLQPTLFLVLVFGSFRGPPKRPVAARQTHTHNNDSSAPYKQLNVLWRLASLPSEPRYSSATRKHEIMKKVSIASMNYTKQSRHWQDPIGNTVL